MITLAGPASSATPINPSSIPARQGNHRGPRRVGPDRDDALTGRSTTSTNSGDATQRTPYLSRAGRNHDRHRGHCRLCTVGVKMTR
ncbi:MAG: hypothetical protein EBU54_08315 [Mycobacteriaceae bacterium]|nr:hypothetical protein [Mycobacteriaceae bacterium]